MISRPEGWVCSGSPCVSGFDPYGLDEFTSQLLHGLSLFIWFYFFWGGSCFYLPLLVPPESNGSCCSGGGWDVPLCVLM